MAVLNKSDKNEMTEIHKVEGTTKNGDNSEICRGGGVTRGTRIWCFLTLSKEIFKQGAHVKWILRTCELDFELTAELVGKEGSRNGHFQGHFFEAVGGRRVRRLQQASERVLGLGKGLHKSRSLQGLHPAR